MLSFVYFILFSVHAFALTPLVYSNGLTDSSKPAISGNHKSNYVEMKLPFEPAQELRLRLEDRLGSPLKNRGEAHVTVITPVEFAVLKPVMSLDEIAELANSQMPSRHRAKPICVGEGRATVDGNLEKTYFVVLSAPSLLRVRQAIAKEFIAKGGRSDAFIPDDFYPHVTLGFTKRDLFESDGVIKDEKTCVYSLRLR